MGRMLPPKYTKTVTVTAQDQDITVTARYGGQEEEDVVVVLEAGSSHTFPEREEDMGTWTAVRKILSISGQVEGEEPFSVVCGDHCEGVHANLHFSPQHQDKKFTLVSKQ